MQITGIEAINLLVGSGSLLGVVLIIFRSGKLIQKIENMNDKIDNFNKNLNESVSDRMNKRFDKVDERLSALEKGQTELRVQLGKLETRVELVLN